MSLEEKSNIISNDILRTNKFLARMNPLRVSAKAMNITSDEFLPKSIENARSNAIVPLHSRKGALCLIPLPGTKQ